MNLSEQCYAALLVCVDGSWTVFDFPDVVESIPGVLGVSRIKHHLVDTGLIEQTKRYIQPGTGRLGADERGHTQVMYVLTDSGCQVLAMRGLVEYTDDSTLSNPKVRLTDAGRAALAGAK